MLPCHLPVIQSQHLALGVVRHIGVKWEMMVEVMLHDSRADDEGTEGSIGADFPWL